MNLSSGYPLWLVQDGLPYNYPALDEDIRTDVLIMGGGISGALAAYHLANAGVEAIVVDARTIGLGSTSASTALLQYEIDTPLSELQHKVGLANAVEAYRLCDQSIDTLAAIAQKIGFKEFVFTSSLYYAAYKKDRSFLEKEFAIRKAHGFDVTFLGQQEMEKQYGFASEAAILSAQGAQTNAYGFAHALHQASIKKGVRVFDRTLLEKIEHKKDAVYITTNNGHKIRAKKLIYANGYEATEYIKEKIVKLESTYAVCSEQGVADKTPFKNKSILWNTADPYLYLRTTADNRVLIGGRDEEFISVARREKLLPKKTRQLTADFEKLYPEISFKPEFSWCGVFGATKDGLPFMGPYQKLPHSLFALGFGGNGITFSLIAAEILTDIITGKKKTAPIFFSLERL
ncbi:MAG: FAD-binding oxidoreductase [Ferruginibacter sp.]|nr:FAD-binding oxidoreductase [Ferruginibacter sp.]